MVEEIKKNPEHIGIIIDGNRRWARERNLPESEGHWRGYQKIKKLPNWFFSRGIKFISVFAFSSDNWKRASDEVNYLMKLLHQHLVEETELAVKAKYRVLISGRVDELPGDLPDACREIESKTKTGTLGTLNICLNYGGRNEIIDMVKKIVDKKISAEQIHEGMIRKYLYHGELPDPDIIVRTSGEERISSFLLWQCAYSELIFLKKYWPDFEETDIDFILEEFGKRKRRYGV